MCPVRPFVKDDIPQVADLCWKFLLHRQAPAPPTLNSFFHELCFVNPWVDSTLPSLVDETASGRIVGFLSVIVRQMLLRGEPIRVAVGGNFVVDPEARTTLSGMRLLKTYMAGDQDLSMTDSANDLSRKLLKGFGFSTILPFSLHWARPLRPGQYAVYAMSRLGLPTFSAGIKFAAKPFCWAVDSMATRLSSSPFRQTVSRLQGAELDVKTLLACLDEFRGGYSLWPQYDGHSLNWLLTFMDRMKAHGDLRKVVLRDDGQKIVGWYIYYVKPSAVGEVVQIGGARQFTRDILDHLFYDAWSHGLIALHGVVGGRSVDDFSEKNCFFGCRGGWMVAHSRRPELLKLLNGGDAFLSRLDGEWCLGFGEGSHVS
jgi:hypothetical protein